MTTSNHQFDLDDTQPIPVYDPATEVAPSHDEQRDGRIGRVHEGIKLIGTDGMVSMTGAEWREYLGLKPSIFASPQDVRDWFAKHTPKPDNDSNA